MILRILSNIDIDPNELEIPKVEEVGSTNVSTILQYTFGIAGGVALIVIIIAGMQFMLSRGDPQKAAIARSAIIYASIGLAIAASAFSIVRFVVGSV